MRALLERLPPWARRLGWLGFLLLALAVPELLDTYGTTVATTVLIYVMLGVGLNIVVGYAGLLDLGYAAFFAIGAYSSALLAVELGLDFWATVPVSIAVTAAAGVVIGYPTLRLRSDYLAIVTLGFHEIVRISITNLEITGGPNGLYGIPAPTLFGRELIEQEELYYLGLAFTVAALAFSWLLARSRLGRAWRSLREDETAAEAVGVPTIRVKLLAYVMGAMVAGVAGPFFVSRFGAVDPTSFRFIVSVEILMVVILGGMGSLPGMVLGGLVVAGLPEVLRDLEDYRLFIFALALIVLMLLRPQGLWPPPRPRRARAAPGAGPAAEPVAAAAAADAAGAAVAQAAPASSAPAVTGPSGAVLLEVEGLRRTFGGVRALDDLSLTVRTGEIVSVIGPNGAGKTTLFNCVTGVIRPSHGQVRLHGERSLRRLRPHRVVGAGLARTFQGIRLFEGMTVADNVLVGRYPRQVSPLRRAGRQQPAAGDEVAGRRVSAVRSAVRGLVTDLLAGASPGDLAEVRRWLDFVGLTERTHELASALSPGDRRRLEIARALASDPELLLLDEPAAGTNPTEKQALMELVRRVRGTGVTVMLIEHDMGMVMGLSDRVIVMDQGRVIAEGTPAEVQADERVIDAYLGRDDEDETSAAAVEEVLGWRS